ncbi:peptide chain release factor N(5)-glutamine methyltransferase [Sphingobacterium kyonggiense]
MQTLGHIRKQFIQDLIELYSEDEIKSIFQIAALEYLEIPKSNFLLTLNEPLSSAHEEILSKILKLLLSGKPIQQIIGKAPFYGLIFNVTEDTLIPRPETEELVDLIIKEQKSQNHTIQIIDIGTGSGCIAISLKKNLSNSLVTAVDISPQALAIAKQNAVNNSTNVEFRCIDILEWEFVFQEEQFDVIVSNPPYITQNEANTMHQNVLRFEPHTALFVENDAPLLFYDYIASFALKHLKNEGALYFEINQYLSIETKDLLIKKGFTKVEVLRDLNQVPRMIKAQF